MSKISFIGLALIICFILFVSGCTSLPNANEKLIGEFNFPKDNSGENSTQTIYNVTIPEEAKTIEVESQNIEELSKPAGLTVFAFEVAPAEGQNPSNYLGYLVDQQSVLTGRAVFKQSGIKGLIIFGENVKGKVKVFVTT